MDFTKVGQNKTEAVVTGDAAELAIMHPNELDRNRVVLKLEEARLQVDSIVSAIKTLEVANDETNQEMSGYVLIATKLVKSVSVHVDALTLPAREFISFTKNFGNGFKAPLIVQVASGKKKIGDHMAKIELERRKEEARLKKEYELRQKQLDEDAKAAHVPPVTLPPPPVVKKDKSSAVQTTEGKTTTSMKWVFEVENDVAVPREFCSPDHQKLREAVKAGKRNITGVRIYEEAQVRIYT